MGWVREGDGFLLRWREAIADKLEGGFSLSFCRICNDPAPDPGFSACMSKYQRMGEDP